MFCIVLLLKHVLILTSMSGETWKAFEGNPVTHSVAHHLMAIAELRTERGYARVTDVARQLGITRGSVSLTLKALRDKGWVVQDDNRFLQLSESGLGLVRAIRAKHAIIARFFAGVLGLPAEQATADACKIEHLLSHGAAMQMLRFMQTHGDPERPLVSGSCASQVPCEIGVHGGCPVCGETCFAELLQGDRESQPLPISLPFPGRPPDEVSAASKAKTTKRARAPASKRSRAQR